MSHEPVMAAQAVDAVRRHVNSARPDAPVVPERERRSGGRMRESADRARRGVAGALRRVAEKVEPRTAFPQSAPRSEGAL